MLVDCTVTVYYTSGYDVRQCATSPSHTVRRRRSSTQPRLVKRVYFAGSWRHVFMLLSMLLYFCWIGQFSLVVKPVDQCHRGISDAVRILSQAVFGGNAVTTAVLEPVSRCIGRSPLSEPQQKISPARSRDSLLWSATAKNCVGTPGS